jgi:DNA modification methylase
MTHRVGNAQLIKSDCFAWLKQVPENSLHPIGTDPPYGVVVYDADQLEKRASGKNSLRRSSMI